MDISIGLVVVVCVACFLAGIMNSSGGSGGLISVPSLMLSGLDSHQAIGTNKVQAVMGLTLAVVRYARGGFIKWQLAIPCAAGGAIGAIIGSNLSLLVSSDFLFYFMFVLLPICAWAVLSHKGVDPTRSEEIVITRKLILTVSLITLIVGMYDGFYGPGSGTFLVVAMGAFTPMGVKSVTAHAKVANLADNVAALIVFLINGKVVLWLGLLAGACNMIGAWIGSTAVMHNGAKIMRPLLILALVLLVINLIIEL